MRRSQSGFGPLRPAALCENNGFILDIVALGKGLRGGLSISAVIGPARIMGFTTSSSMQTLHGNPICTAAGYAVLDEIENSNLVENARKVGEHLQRGLRARMQNTI
jgi:4-aminobutyrate aminotransferase